MKGIKNIGYIYKITNLVNGKCYIGQTSQNIRKRWRDHINTSNEKNSNYYNYPLYKAFRKYGINNFKFEIIEECNVNELNEKEIFYIEEFNSYKDGYNQTLGGGGHKTFDVPIEDIISSYLELKTIGKVAKKFKMRTDYVSKILNDNNIKIKTEEEHAKEKGNKVYRCDLDGNILEEYICLNEAGKWLFDNNLTNARDARNAASSIKKNIIKGKSYKGFIWKCNLYEEIDSNKYFENQINSKKEKNKINPDFKSKGKECLLCQKIISNTSTYYNDCNNQRKKQKAIEQREEALGLSRDILKEEIRTMSFLQIGKKYGVSDNSIRKWCKKYYLPYKSSEIKAYSDDEWKDI